MNKELWEKTWDLYFRAEAPFYALPGILSGYTENSANPFDLCNNAKKMLLVSLREQGLKLNDQFDEAGLNDARYRFWLKYRSPIHPTWDVHFNEGVYIWQEFDSIDEETRNEAIEKAFVEFLLVCEDTMKLAATSGYSSKPFTAAWYNYAHVLFARGATPESICALVKRNFPNYDQSSYLGSEYTFKEILTKIQADPPKKIKNGGCYVATAVYGSYDCPEVWTLRRFRDYDLARTAKGRLFIKTYYAISPTLVKWFGETKWFKALFRRLLDKLIEKCREKGYSSNPYDDPCW